MTDFVAATVGRVVDIFELQIRTQRTRWSATNLLWSSSTHPSLYSYALGDGLLCLLIMNSGYKSNPPGGLTNVTIWMETGGVDSIVESPLGHVGFAHKG